MEYIIRDGKVAPAAFTVHPKPLMLPQVVSRYVGDHVVMDVGRYSGGIDATIVSETVRASRNVPDAVVPLK